MQKIKRYKIIDSKYAFELAEKVEQEIKEGWQPFGAPFVTNAVWPLNQALVEYDASSCEREGKA